MDNVFTVPDLARRMNLSAAVIKTAVKDLSPDLSMNEGYYKLYNIERVQAALIERNRPLLVALGFIAPTGQGENIESEESE